MASIFENYMWMGLQFWLDIDFCYKISTYLISKYLLLQFSCNVIIFILFFAIYNQSPVLLTTSFSVTLARHTLRWQPSGPSHIGIGSVSCSGVLNKTLGADLCHEVAYLSPIYAHLLCNIIARDGAAHTDQPAAHTDQPLVGNSVAYTVVEERHKD